MCPSRDGRPDPAANSAPDGPGLPEQITCPICGGKMHLLHDDAPEWFYECEACGTVAFP